MNLMTLLGRRSKLVDPAHAHPGHPDPIPLPKKHEVLGTPLEGPWPEGHQVLTLGAGCFWGVEKQLWQLPGVHTTLVGYAGGYSPNPRYEEVCSGTTGHTEAVQVVYDPARTSTEQILKAFWEGHDPTQGMRQGNDVGTQYRSMILWETQEQREAAERTRDAYQAKLTAAGYDEITTEIVPLEKFYPAEAYHQQYLAKNPYGYCGHGGTGISCPVGVVQS